MTEFGATIMVTLRVELYAALNDLASTLKAKLASVIESKDARRSTKPAARTPRKAETKMLMRAFILEPRVNVLENLTPYALNKVFELLKIGDPEAMIPPAVHAAITSNAEKLLFALKQLAHELDTLYDPESAAVESPVGASAVAPMAPIAVEPRRIPSVPRAPVAGQPTLRSTSSTIISPRSRVAQRLGLVGSSPQPPRPSPVRTPNLARVSTHDVMRSRSRQDVRGDGGLFSMLEDEEL